MHADVLDMVDHLMTWDVPDRLCWTCRNTIRQCPLFGLGWYVRRKED